MQNLDSGVISTENLTLFKKQQSDTKRKEKNCSPQMEYFFIPSFSSSRKQENLELFYQTSLASRDSSTYSLTGTEQIISYLQ